MLRYVKNSRILDLPSLESLPKRGRDAAEKIYRYARDKSRKIGKTIGEKMEYLPPVPTGQQNLETEKVLVGREI